VGHPSTEPTSFPPAKLNDLHVGNLIPNPQDFQFPSFEAQGKKAPLLMQPQELMKQLLPVHLYEQLIV